MWYVNVIDVYATGDITIKFYINYVICKLDSGEKEKEKEKEFYINYVICKFIYTSHASNHLSRFYINYVICKLL